MELNEFIEIEKLSKCRDSYSKCRVFFYTHKGQLSQEEIASKAAQMLLAYLDKEGHLRSLGYPKGEQVVADIIAFVSENSAPFDWKVEDEDYVEKLSDLYTNFQDLCKLEQKNQLLLITRLISVVYGCCPAFTPQLLALLDLRLDTQDACLCFIRYHQLALVPWFLAAFLILNNPNANDTQKAWAKDTLQTICEDIEKRNNNNYLPKI